MRQVLFHLLPYFPSQSKFNSGVRKAKKYEEDCEKKLKQKQLQRELLILNAENVNNLRLSKLSTDKGI